MGVKYLLDTNILSELCKNEPNSNVVKLVERYSDRCTTASLVIHEISFGINRLPKGELKRDLQLFLRQIENYQFSVLPYDNPSAIHHAKERARLSAIGLTPSFVDGQIAAIATVNNLTIVTRNTNDFKYFKNLEIENWFE